MSSLIRFKFKNAKDGDAIYFEGSAMTVEALHAAILQKKGLEGGPGLIITDASTGEEFAKDAQVPKNSSVVVRMRPPAASRIILPPKSSAAPAASAGVVYASSLSLCVAQTLEAPSLRSHHG